MEHHQCANCDEVDDLVSQLHELFQGKQTANVMIAMAYIYGVIEAHAAKPDIDGLMGIIRDAATESFDQTRDALKAQPRPQ